MEPILEKKTKRNPSSAPYIYFAILTVLLLLPILALVWSIADNSLSLIPFSILALSGAFICPIFAFFAFPTTIPRKIFKYSQQGDQGTLIESRMISFFVVGILLASIFLLIYGCDIFFNSSRFGIYYLSIGTLGTLGSGILTVKLLTISEYGKTKVTISESRLIVESMNTSIDISDPEMKVSRKHSKYRPKLTVVGNARIARRGKTVSHSPQSVTLSPFNCGELSLTSIKNLLESSG